MDDLQKASITKRKKFQGIWFIPLIALLIGAWMVFAHWRSLGPEIQIEFATAEGIEPGKTKIKSLSVEVGLVESIKIKDDLKGVVIQAQLEREFATLLRSDTQFWVVRPRVTAAGVSGLGTLLSGAYIELSPGVEKVVTKRKQSFKGLDEVPPTPQSEPGLRITLLSSNASSVSTGDPITYRGYQVGKVEKTRLDVGTQNMVINAFIEEPFDSLVTSNTRFWNASGISFDLSPTGVELQTASLTSLLIGGISFGLPRDTMPGEPVTDNTEFKLYPSEDSIHEILYEHFVEFLLFFETSVSGLEVGAPVMYRGIRMGTVMDVSFKYASVEAARRKGERAVSIPVLIRIEPGRYLGEDSAASLENFHANLIKSVEEGARASIKLGNLLTGSRLVTLDFYSDIEPGKIGKVGKFTTLPTVSTGIESIERKLSGILTRINKIPMEEIAGNADAMLKQVTQTVATAEQAMADLHKILASQSAQQLPESLNATLEELKQVLEGLAPGSPVHQSLANSIDQLNTTLRNIENLTYTLDTKPSSLIFSKPQPPDTQPEAAQK